MIHGFLSCFCGGVSSSDETTDAKIKKKPRWPRFRAKKTVVPADSAMKNNATAKDSIGNCKNNRNMTVKKAFFQAKHKEKKWAGNPQKSSICHAITNCKTNIQTDRIHNATDRCCKNNRIESREEISSILGPNSTSVISTGQKKKQNKKKNICHRPEITYGHIFLVLILVTMIFGGRFVATISLAACFYILPYFRTKKNVMYYDQRKGYNQTEVDYLSSDQYKKMVVLQGLLERKRTK